MQVCPHCGQESRDIDRYCLHCGQRMDASGESDVLPTYSAIPDQARGAAAPVSGGAGGRGPVGKRAMAAGAKNPPPAMTPRNTAVARLVLKTHEGGQENTREYPLDGRDIVIGRAPACDVVLPSDQLASRRHSQLEYDGVRYTIRDLGSSNGTYVNGEEIHQVAGLNDGDTITVGEHELVYSRVAARNTDGFPIPVPPPWPPVFNGTSGQPAGPTEKHSAVSSARHQTPGTPAPQAAPSPPRGPTGAPATSADGGDIEQLHRLLVDASAGMVRRAEEAERQVADLRAMFAELDRQVGAALGAMAGDAQPSGGAGAAAERRIGELVRLARAAADNPRHLDHLSALAARAGDIADALEAEGALARGLGGLRARLAELSREPAHEPE